MDITPLIPQGVQIIQSYAEGKFRISGQAYDGPILVFPDHVEPWAVSTPLGCDDFAALDCQAEPQDVFLVGCGKGVPSDIFALRRALKDKGINCEFMDTGAACRTFNVLLTEGRRVAAALLPV